MIFLNRRLLLVKAILVCVGLWLTVPQKLYAEPLVVGYSSVTSVFLPFWIGNEAGFYKKEGLDAQLIYIASSTTMAQAMFAREVAISTVNSGSVVSSGLQGGDLVLMGASVPAPIAGDSGRASSAPARSATAEIAAVEGRLAVTLRDLRGDGHRLDHGVHRRGARHDPARHGGDPGGACRPPARGRGDRRRGGAA